jgi:predicted AAA+ superfamily ATPase
MIPRTLASTIDRLRTKFPIVALIGPRQSGKTTLVRSICHDLPYASLEDPDRLAYASRDPRGFLKDYPTGAIFDEVQRLPILFSYLQTIVDEANVNGRFVLTGSQNFLLHEKITQTLAGRVALTRLLPFSFQELSAGGITFADYEDYLLHGFYPRLHDHKIDPGDWFPSYIQTYLERDVRQIKNITNLSAFLTFLKLCAGRCGQLLNMSAIAADCGISHTTAREWLTVLEASYVIFLLRPHHHNGNKRLVKMPKLYFYDTGLAAYLLGIRTSEQMKSHYAKGALFESFIIADMMKQRLHNGREPDLFFWRDKNAREIDVIIDTAGQLTPLEIKSARTIAADFFDTLRYWQSIAGPVAMKSWLVYGGNETQQRTECQVVPWTALDSLP